jgi:crossover junction endodeoxyribonuclease RusA
VPSSRGIRLSRSKPVALRVSSYRPFRPSSPKPAIAPDLSQLLSRKTRRTRHSSPLAPIPASSRSTILPDRLTITLPVPPSINHQYATVNARRVLSSVGRGYKALVGRLVLVALSQSPYREPLHRMLRDAPLSLAIRFHFQSPLRRDVDGGLKIAQDALCEALGVNDNRITEIHLYKQADPHNPRIEVSLGPTVSTGIPCPSRTPIVP